MISKNGQDAAATIRRLASSVPTATHSERTEMTSTSAVTAYSSQSFLLKCETPRIRAGLFG
jgi:hypothetical protein